VEDGATMMVLDSQQTAAVETQAPRAMVLAGAGSGKTRVLIERILYLIRERKVSPYEIMAFTFTRKAAQEMRHRLDLRNDGIGGVTMGTMHSLALKMLRKFGEEIGLKPHNITIYGEWESDYLLREIAIEMGIFNGKAWKIPKKKIDAAFFEYYSKGIEPSREDQAYDIFKVFIGRCRENNALTYGALLVGLRFLIPTMGKYLHIKHILVDEVQDIDPLQWMIILEMERAFGAQLYVVGDIDQSIYEFRGAAPDYLVKHQNDFSVFKIVNNYRSRADIVWVANRLIEHNEERIPKTMYSTRESAPGTVTVLQKMNGLALANHISSGDGMPSAILCRNHQPLAKISEALTETGIDHVYIGRKASLTNSEHFRRFHAFLKLLVNPYDNFSFLLIREILGVDRTNYGYIREEAARCEESHFQAWLKACDYEDERTLQCWFSVTAPALGLLDLAEAIGAIGDVSGWDDSNAIINFIFEWFGNKATNDFGVAGYLDWLATYDIQDEIEEVDEGKLVLMTIHAAKGLEWPTVIIAGVNEGLLPSKQAIKSGDLEAERRLAYVAWTRAMDQLILAVRPEVSIDENGRQHESPVSRFVEESLGSQQGEQPSERDLPMECRG